MLAAKLRVGRNLLIAPVQGTARGTAQCASLIAPYVLR